MKIMYFAGFMSTFPKIPKIKRKMECISTKCCSKSYHSCLINIDFFHRNNKIVSSYVVNYFLNLFLLRKGKRVN